jgi:hypothetical protein
MTINDKIKSMLDEHLFIIILNAPANEFEGFLTINGFWWYNKPLTRIFNNSKMKMKMSFLLRKRKLSFKEISCGVYEISSAVPTFKKKYLQKYKVIDYLVFMRIKKLEKLDELCGG